MTQPKIAIVTDWITDMGGVARVDAALHEVFPDAPIYTSVYEPDALAREYFEGLDIRTSWLQKLPKPLRKMQRLFPILRIWAFRSFDLSEYDIIISSSSAESKQVRKTRPDQIHICYCHTPIRYYWSHTRQYLKDPGLGLLSWPARIVLVLSLPLLRYFDYKAAQNVDFFLANSNEVKNRIEKYYTKDSTVIFPPVSFVRFDGYAKPNAERTHYLAHGRQVPYKRVDLAVRACTELNVPLIVSGGGPEHENLKKIAGPSVTFEHLPPDERVNELFGSAKAYIFPVEEDFGIVQVESLASGTPVIALNKAGSLDIVQDGVHGVLFDEQTVESLKQAIQKAESIDFDQESLKAQAKRFDISVFKSKIADFVAKMD